MEKNNIEFLKARLEEIEQTLRNLAELIEIRNNLLLCFEANLLRKIKKQVFSYLNANSRGTTSGGIFLIKKNYDLDLKLLRRGQFFLHKRRRRLLEDQIEINNLLKSQVGKEDPSLSA